MAEEKENLRDRIVVDPEVMAGKPVIKGTRVPVYVILEFIESGHTIREVTEAYPDLTERDVKAAIRYATDIVERKEVVTGKAVA